MTTLEFHGLPSLPAEYARALTRLRRPSFTGTLPKIEAIARGISADPEQIAKYCSLCSIPQSDTLPITYPQVLATPLHGAILSSSEFPFPPLGLVHRGNVIIQHRRLPSTTALDLRACLGATRKVSRGVEFDLETYAEVLGERIWQSTTTVLVRDKGFRTPRSSLTKRTVEPPPGEEPDRARSVILSIPEDMGRRYAHVSGDYNPIHLHALAARPFGFRRAIVQGMWSLARCVGELTDDLQASALSLEVRFERPVELPSRLLLSSAGDDGELTFAMKRVDGTRTYLEGRIHPFTRSSGD